MKSIKYVYRIGNGPSSSHTVGPYRAAKYILNKYPNFDYEVTLYGSLAKTGYGHGTINAINEVLPNCKVYLDENETNLKHPNTMIFKILKNNEILDEITILSIGGGTINIVGNNEEEVDIYPHNSFKEILEYCKSKGITLVDYVYKFEDVSIKEYLSGIWKQMQQCIEEGLSKEGNLPGPLKLDRKAKRLFDSSKDAIDSQIRKEQIISSFAYAVSEENASENVVVTAPSCGSCGVLPSVLYYLKKYENVPDLQIINALAVAGIIGNIIKTNASISGAECGCQAEIGSACSMTAGAYSYIFGLSLDQIEFACETAMEHNLGLTCDPVMGLVQIPCIERNAVSAIRAINASNMSRYLYQTRRISFDEVIDTMYRTGKDLNDKYRETAHGGLASLYRGDKKICN